MPSRSLLKGYTPLFLGFVMLSATACAAEPHDALARLHQVAGPTANLPARELLVEGAQQYIIVCPKQKAADVALFGDSGGVPDDGFDRVINALLSIGEDGTSEKPTTPSRCITCKDETDQQTLPHASARQHRPDT